VLEAMINCMNETEFEVATVRAQAKLFAGFREQLQHHARRYREEGKFNLEAILQDALRM
jgi:hypothetical protein